MEPVTLNGFEEWKSSPVTQKFFKKLVGERETMKEGLINDVYEHPELVKGMCRAIANILDITYEELYDAPKQS